MKRLFSYILFFVGVLLVGAAIFLTWHTSGSSGAAPGVPASVAGLPLAQQQTGEAAIASVKQLHLGDFPVASAVVATYGQQNATLWVTGAESAAQAQELVTRMEASIAQGGSNLTPLNVFQFSGRDVYMLDGLGQAHFYFVSGRQVIWLSVDTASAEQALKEVLAFYP